MAIAVITRQEFDQYDFSNPSTPALGVVVYFQTDAGNIGSVFVPQARYKVPEVRKMVAAAARIADEVGALEISY